MAFAMERAGSEDGANGRGQGLIGHRSHRPTSPPRNSGWQCLMAIDAGAGEVPDTTDPGQAIGLAADRRGRPAHRLSRRRVLRLTREHGLLAHRRAGRAHGPKAHDGTITTERVDLMWGSDLTSVMTGEGQAAVFVAVDHCSAECVGIHAHARATRFEALEPIRQGVRQRFGGFAKAVARGLAVRHDHGSQYMSDHFQKEITFLGIESSPAFVRAPEGNGCAERFIRTLKENLLWVRTFENIEELRQALLAFRDIYNTTWLIERHATGCGF